jgi:transposase, IS30 family
MYKHLSLEEREKLIRLHDRGLSLRDIAKILNRSDTTLGRELKRNKTGHGKVSNEYLSMSYLPCKAQIKAETRAIKQRTKAPLKNVQIFLYVREHLRKPYYWTPEQISGRIKLDHPGESISVETIYQYIYSKKAKRFKLWLLLPECRKKRMKRGGRTVHRESKIKNAVSIDLRPEIVSSRARGGDYETDNVIGKATDKTALSVTVERLARYTILTKLKDRKAITKQRAITTRLAIYQEFNQTMTFDNGSENTNHQQIAQDLKITTFFCHAYHSWEKGAVENTNKRVRRFIPKGVSIDTISDKKIKEIELILNNTPRKCLGYLTPEEKMIQLLNSSTV